MASDDLALVQAQHRHDNVQNHPQLVFPGSYCTPPPSTKHGVSGVDSIPKATTTSELSSSLVDQHNSNYFIHQPTPVDFRRPMFSTAPSSTGRDSHNWKASGGASISGDVSEGEDTADDYDDEEEDADQDEEIEVQGLVPCANNAKNNNNNVRSNPTSDNTDGDQIGVHNQISAIDLKEGNVVKHIGNERSNDEMRNDVIMANADGQIYCSQYVQGTRRLESNATPKNSMEIENGCGSSGRKDPIQSIDSGEKLRTILSDPVTGALMDDAMILACGHSFGSGGIQHVLRMKACYTCSHAVSDNSVSPNLSLRDAVQAFRREEELLANCAAKRRRERYEQDKGANVESSVSGHQRGRGLQFPFAVTDRVIIKGNKRTPPRFVGREAIVTTQCLNGWYVVKTLDNAESVKLQYRSLAKVPDNQSPTPTPMPISSKMPTNWL